MKFILLFSKDDYIGRFPFEEAVVRRCSVEKMFLEILQNLQEKNCA